MPVTAGGYIEPDAVRERLRPDTLVVSVMHANNETGVLQPVIEVSRFVGWIRRCYFTQTPRRRLARRWRRSDKAALTSCRSAVTRSRVPWGSVLSMFGGAGRDGRRLSRSWWVEAKRWA